MDAKSCLWIYPFFRFSLLLLAYYILLGCNSASASPKASLRNGTALKTPASATIQVTSNPTPSATFTASPTINTPFFTLFPVATPTSTLLNSPTVVPTLLLHDAHLRLLDILADNGGCLLPCLWGITPGESSDEEAKTVLMPFSGISDFTVFTPEVGNISPSYTEDGLLFSSDIDFLINENQVTSVFFNGRALKKYEENGVRGVENIFDSRTFGERFKSYMLSQILSTHGRPSTVMLETLAKIPSPNRDPGVNFQILLLYPDQGILANYTSKQNVVGENIVGCPANAHLEFELTPSGNKDYFYERLAQTKWTEKYIQTNYKPLEEVTSMSVDEFYQTFRQATGKCLETPANLWPEPEK